MTQRSPSQTPPPPPPPPPPGGAASGRQGASAVQASHSVAPVFQHAATLSGVPWKRGGGVCQHGRWQAGAGGLLAQARVHVRQKQGWAVARGANHLLLWVAVAWVQPHPTPVCAWAGHIAGASPHGWLSILVASVCWSLLHPGPFRDCSQDEVGTGPVARWPH